MRKLMLPIVITVVASLLAVCVACAAPAPAPSPAPAPAPTPAPAPPKVIQWTVQNNYPGISVGIQADKIWHWMEEASGGRLKMNIVAAPGVAPVPESFDAVSRGVLDGIQTHVVNYTRQIPEAALLCGPPFAWDSMVEAYDCYYNRGLIDISDELHAKYDTLYIPQITNGRRFIGGSVPAYSIKDLQGRKLRALGFEGKYMEALGVHTVSIPGPEVYNAMKLGTIEGAIWSVSTLPIFKDVMPYYVISPNFGADNGALLWNLDSWNALPDDLRELFERDLPKANLAFACDTIMMEKKAMAECKDTTEFITWSDEDAAKAIDVAMQTYYEELINVSPEAKKLIDIIKGQMMEVGKLK